MSASTPYFFRLLSRLLIGMLLASGAATAATVRAYIQPEKAQTGQMVTYVIAVQNGVVQRQPELRLPSQVTLSTGLSTSQRMEFRGTERTVSTQLSWGVTAVEPGEFVIPPQEVHLRDEVLKTNEVRLVVTEASAVPGAGQGGDDANTPLFQIEVGKTEFYQGELVPITASLYVPRSVMVRRVGLIDVNKNDFAIARFPQQSDQTQTVINGIGYLVASYRSMLSALHPGDLKVGPASCELLLEVYEQDPQQMRRSLPFGMMMGNSETRKQVVKSQDVKVKVLPLPTEGRPPQFNGAVGDFSLTATATPNELTVGDPLAVDVTVEGIGNFEGLNPPELTPPDGWKTYPPRRYNVDGPVDPNLTPTAQRRIGYSMVFVPEKEHTELPPFELSYFSPTQKKYITARTAPIALHIKPGAPALAAADGAASTGGMLPKQPVVQQPKPNISNILMVMPAKAEWLNTAVATSAPLTSSPRFWAVQAIPALLVILASLFTWFRRSREESTQGVRGELRQLWEGLEQRDLDDRDFLQRAAHFIQRSHRGPVTDPELQQILQRYETLSFTASHSDAAPLDRTERSRILGKLSSLMKSAVTVLATLAVLTASAASAADESPDEVYRQAKEMLEKGKFTDAQYLGESLTKRTPPALSAEVFSIIGHARYKQEDMGRAALWYQRAQLLQPTSPEVRQNLRHLDEKLRFFRFHGGSPLQEWSLLLANNTWIIAAAAGMWLIFLPILWRILSGSRSSGVLMWLFIGLGFFVIVPSVTFASVRPAPDARVKDIFVVTVPEVSAYTSATVTSGSVIDLPPGSQLRLLEKRGSWSYVEIPSSGDHVRGWVESGKYTPLWPWDTALLP